ncbi:MAG: epoxyqueuosine reductase, partial [Sphingomicrobium sp.]
MTIEQEIRAKAAELGFVACGFARADAAAHAGPDLRGWLGEGRHGEMLWIEERAGQRASPQGL